MLKGRDQMDFFDKLGKKASEAYKLTADKTGKIAKEAKLRMKISDLKSQINDIYEEIGKKVYENHVREEKEDLNKSLEEECIRIDVLSDEIEDKLKQCLDLKDKKQCPNCYKEIDKNMKFCPECGAKQEDEEVEVKEVEILDVENDNRDTKTENEDKESTEIKQENSSNMQSSNNYEKEDVQSSEKVEGKESMKGQENVESQGNTESQENIESTESNYVNNDSKNSDEQNNLEKTVEVESNPQIPDGEELSEEKIKNLYREEDKYENS